jgi:hypothetical protein
LGTGSKVLNLIGGDATLQNCLKLFFLMMLGSANKTKIDLKKVNLKKLVVLVRYFKILMIEFKRIRILKLFI